MGLPRRRALSLSQSGFVSTRFAGYLRQAELSESARKKIDALLAKDKAPAKARSFLDTTPQLSVSGYLKALDVFLSETRARGELVCFSLLPELYDTKELMRVQRHLENIDPEDKRRLLVFVESDAGLYGRLRDAGISAFFRADSLEALDVLLHSDE